MIDAADHPGLGPGQPEHGFDRRLLGGESEQRRDAGHRRAGDDGDRERDRHRAPQSRELVDVAGAGPHVDLADDHEQRGLEHGVGDQDRDGGERRLGRSRATSSAIIRPSCDTVPQARISLASTWRSAPMAPQTIEARPNDKPERLPDVDVRRTPGR